jgi:hypothetical protein
MNGPYDPAKLPPRSRGLNAITGAMSLVVVLLMVQIWLLSATLDSYLAGRGGGAVPAAIISLVMFLASFALYLFVGRIDRETRKD